LELQNDVKPLRENSAGRSRMTYWGLAVRRAWKALPHAFPGLLAQELTLYPMSLKGVVRLESESKGASLTEVVRHFKKQCQEQYQLQWEFPSDVWTPGFTEEPLHPDG